MKKLTIFATALLIFGCVTTNYIPNKFDILDTEGLIAFVMADGAKVSQPDKKPSECPCNGTKKVKTGDGINVTECTCGESCACAKQEKNINERSKRVLMLTSKRCSPCNKFKKTAFPPLKKNGWTIEENNNTALIEVIECDENDEVWFAKDDKTLKRYKIENKFQNIPLFILVDDGKVIDQAVGLQTPKEFTDFFYKERQ